MLAMKKMLGSPMLNNCQIVSMLYTGTKPKAGDIVKLNVAGNWVEVTTTNTDRAYGVVAPYKGEGTCPVVIKGNVLANLTSPTVGSATFVVLDVVRKVDAVDENGTDSSNGYEVKL